MSNPKLEQDFENEARRIARAKWPCAQYSGAQMLDGKERDGIFETEDTIHFVEATVSGSAGKAKDDTKKLFKAISDHNQTGSLKVAMGWFITKNEPTADQRGEVKTHGKGQVRAVSFSQFQQSLIDVRAYLSARKSHFFGSVQDFDSASNSPSVPYVEIGLTDSSTGDALYIKDVLRKLTDGNHLVITGQYGAGKSMTLREIFLKLEQQYIAAKTSTFPIYINLREHSGQRDPIEILERHARSIGFDSPNSLIRAWRAGFTVLLIDGFDEVTSLGVQGTWKKLKDLRKRSLEGVRRLIRESNGIGVAVSGRSSYFEAEIELFGALGMTNASLLTVDEFTDDQMHSFLSRFPGGNGSATLPAWVPTRPLLLGYLASKNLLNDLSGANKTPDAVDGWNYLLDRIYQREERIESNLDGATLRRILERVATIARASEDQLGPITRTDLFSAFNEVCGYEPDEQGMLAIQRLPGLGIYRAEDESRCFIDAELAGVCNGRELFRFIESPYDTSEMRIWSDVMSAIDRPISAAGICYVTRVLGENADGRGLIRQSIAFANGREDLKCLRGDIAAILVSGNIAVDIPLTVKEMNFEKHQLEFGQDLVDMHELHFSHCLFGSVLIESDVIPERLPHFFNCMFELINGRLSALDMPKLAFDPSCEYAAFDSSTTSGAIRAGQLSAGEKVLLVTLRKLYVQSLSGRAEGALYRGLDVDERRYIPDVLRLLKKHHLATEYNRGDGVVWLPTRKELHRVKRIISAPAECHEEVVIEARLVK